MMVQREIKRKTRTYGTIAFLSATILVSLIYVFGTVPGLFPPWAGPRKRRSWRNSIQPMYWLQVSTSFSSGLHA